MGSVPQFNSEDSGMNTMGLATGSSMSKGLAGLAGLSMDNISSEGMRFPVERSTEWRN